MTTILEQLKELQTISGTNAKKKFLATTTPEFKEFLVLALDPYQMYYVRDYPEPTNRTVWPYADDNFKVLKDLLDKLRSRELTGNRAKDSCTQAQVHGVPRELIMACLTKDIRAGVAAKSINEVFPDLIPEFSVALCEPYDPARTTFPVWVSTKYDGLRCLAFCELDGTVEFKTRNGLPIPAAEPLKGFMWRFFQDHFAQYGSCVFDAEILTGTFQESVSALRKKSKTAEDARLVIFDWLKIERFLDKFCSLTYVDRIHPLQQAELLEAHSKPLERKVYVSNEFKCYDHESVMNHYHAARLNKQEGVIVKQDKPYCFGRSYDWMKIKAVETRDCRVTNVIEGKGKYKGTTGMLEVQWSDTLRTTVSGMDDEQRNRWWRDKNLIIDKVVEVLYQNETDDGLPRHGRFACVREDKS